MENLFAGRRTMEVQSFGNTIFLSLSFREFVMDKKEASALLFDIIQRLETC